MANDANTDHEPQDAQTDGVQTETSDDSGNDSDLNLSENQDSEKTSETSDSKNSEPENLTDAETFGDPDQVSDAPPKNDPQKPTRAEKRKAFWNQSVIEKDGEKSVDPLKFAELFEKNPKGAEKFLEDFNDENDTELALDDLVEKSQSGMATRLAELEQKLDELQNASRQKSREESGKAFSTQMNALLQTHKIERQAFRDNYRDDFLVWTNHYQKNGDTLLQAADKAFSKVVLKGETQKSQEKLRKSAKISLSSSDSGEIKSISQADLAALPQDQFNRTRDLIDQGKIEVKG